MEALVSFITGFKTDAPIADEVFKFQVFFAVCCPLFKRQDLKTETPTVAII